MADADELRTAVIVEDDPDVRHLIASVFESAGFSVVSVGNGLDGVRAALAYKPLITTLDVSMPGIDGFEAARRIRAGGSPTFIIMVSAMAEESDVIQGLDAGADDYIVKPFNPKELVARIRTRLRPTPETSGAPLRIGDLTIDVAAHEVRRAGEIIGLTPLEFELLVALAAKPHQVFSREMLLEQVWGYHYKADTRLVNVHVQRLRAKVELDADNPQIVTTVRGVGYRAGAVV